LVPPFAQTPLSPSFLPTTRLIFNPDPSRQYEGYFAGQASSLRVKKKACSHFAPSLNGGPWLAAFIETPTPPPFQWQISAKQGGRGVIPWVVHLTPGFSVGTRQGDNVCHPYPPPTHHWRCLCPMCPRPSSCGSMCCSSLAQHYRALGGGAIGSESVGCMPGIGASRDVCQMPSPPGRGRVKEHMGATCYVSLRDEIGCQGCRRHEELQVGGPPSAMLEERNLALRQLRPSCSGPLDTPLPAQQSRFFRHLYLGFAQQLAGCLRLRMAIAPSQPPANTFSYHPSHCQFLPYAGRAPTTPY
jgi:hypothetical protein